MSEKREKQTKSKRRIWRGVPLIRHSGHVPPIFMEKHEKGGSMDFT